MTSDIKPKPKRKPKVNKNALGSDSTKYGNLDGRIKPSSNAGSNDERSRFSTLQMSSIVDFSAVQGREPFDAENDPEDKGMVKSVKSTGVHQPVGVIPVEEGSREYRLIFGWRRWNASKVAGKKKIAARIYPMSYTGLKEDEIAIVENSQRSDLNPMEIAKTAKLFTDLHKYSHEEIADLMGISRSAMSKHLELLNAPEELQSLIAQKKIGVSNAYDLVKKHKGDQTKIIKALKNGADYSDAIDLSGSEKNKSSNSVNKKKIKSEKEKKEVASNDFFGETIKKLTDKTAKQLETELIKTEEVTEVDPSSLALFAAILSNSKSFEEAIKTFKMTKTSMRKKAEVLYKQIQKIYALNALDDVQTTVVLESARDIISALLDGKVKK